MAPIMDEEELLARLAETPAHQKVRLLEREADRWLVTETDLSAAARGLSDVAREVTVGLLRSEVAGLEVIA